MIAKMLDQHLHINHVGVIWDNFKHVYKLLKL